MVKALESGAVYSVASVNTLQKVRTVHRELLKCVVQPVGAALPSELSPPVAVVPSDEPSDGELWMLVSDVHQPVADPLAQALNESAGTSPVLGSAVDVSLPVLSSESQHSQTLAQCGAEAGGLRRTSRSTAGSHTNIRHLSRPAGGHVRDFTSISVDSVSHSQTVFVRPWL